MLASLGQRGGLLVFRGSQLKFRVATKKKIRALSAVSQAASNRPLSSSPLHSRCSYDCPCHRNHDLKKHGSIYRPTLPHSKVMFSQCRTFSSDNDGKGGNEAVAVDVNASLTGDSADSASDLGIPGAQKGGKKLAIVFTCTVCDTRSAKQFTENSYKHGVVIVQCPGCKNRHLIADNLGFFDDADGGWNIEKGMANLGEDVRVVTNDDVLELSVEDVWGDISATPKSSEDDETETNTTKD